MTRSATDYRTEIVVDDVRELGGFMHLKPAAGGWRVVVIDSIDELNRNAANALLKVLEEPPAQALMLLVSHAPGRLLPTIRSRCRRLTLGPLDARVMEGLLRPLLSGAGGGRSPPADPLAEGSHRPRARDRRRRRPRSLPRHRRTAARNCRSSTPPPCTRSATASAHKDAAELFRLAHRTAARPGSAA